ncbi:MAG: cation-translocating P-type ATPase [Spirochaetes bacterium]|nr:cation-translocating P-type ATPase [Spirochaetota bacterium]
MDWYRMTTNEMLNALKSDILRGLAHDEGLRRLQEHGRNELVDRGVKSPWKILFEQFTSVMVLILLAAAVISIFAGDLKDAVAILAIVVLFGVLGFIQEYRAEKAMAALRRMAVPDVRVRRDGEVREVPASQLVPGDIVLLEAGNVVPADMRILESGNLRIQESALTGESEPIEKETAAMLEDSLPLGDRRNMAFMGTSVTYGRGVAAVVATGMNTELGRIASLIQSVESEMTPLQRRLDHLGKALGAVAILVAVVIFVLGVIGGESLELMFMMAVSIAVAAVPEGLPAVVTITLALGAKRMLKRQALIRKLPAVETLGSVTVICSDKTGTLTENRMTVMVLDVAGHRLEQETEELRRGMPVGGVSEKIPQQVHSSLALLLMGGTLCNDAALRMEAPGRFRTIGDPTEGAMVVMAAQAGLMKPDLDRQFPRTGEVPFDSDRKRMTTIHEVGGAITPVEFQGVWEGAFRVLGSPQYLAFTKGSPDGLVAISDRVWVGDRVESMSGEWRERIMRANDELAQSGMRVLGVALRVADGANASDSIEHGMVFVGLFGMIDPPRPEVKEAVRTCLNAGIRPIMITGDHPLTARQIAGELGITLNGEVLTGQEVERMSPEELRGAVAGVSVFARVSPEHKLKIVGALQAQGEIASMTGDGVNDAPALKKADIGVAMGITGTDVSKEAADMVLLDDNFATIVAAVEEGRVIFDNIKKFVKFSVGGNIGKILVALLGPLPLLGLPLPLQPLQLLWLNLLTDGLLGLGMGVEPAEKEVMHRPPARPGESFFAGGMTGYILMVGLLTGAAALATGLYYYHTGSAYWQTMIFTVLCFSQIGQALGTRSVTESFFKSGVLSNPVLLAMAAAVVLAQLGSIYLPVMNQFVRTVPLPVADMAIAVAVSSVVFWAIEIQKLLRRWRRR